MRAASCMAQYHPARQGAEARQQVAGSRRRNSGGGGGCGGGGAHLLTRAPALSAPATEERSHRAPTAVGIEQW